jgi:hypothetical protein
MRLAIAILGALVIPTVVLAQSRDGFTGPLTGYEAQLISDVWYEIREVENFEDINWRSHGLNGAPASPETQRFLALHWDELRREERFSKIEWDKYLNDQSKRSRRAERHADNDGPFTREEAAAMSRVWDRMRAAERFEDIDWRRIGLSGKPGDRDARRLMSRHWGQLRGTTRFEDIDWQASTGYRPR